MKADAFDVAAATLAFIAAIFAWTLSLIPDAFGAAAAADDELPFWAFCDRAASIAAFARASAMILLTSGFAAGPRPLFCGAGDP